jgi:hypothetical protein
MAKSNSILIQIGAVTRSAVKEIDKVTKSLGQVDKSGKGLGKALKVGLGAVTAGAAGVAYAFVDMAKAAYSDQQQASKLDRTLKTLKGTTDAQVDATAAWIDKMELLTLVSDTDLRTAIGRLALVTKDLSDAQKLTALSADAAVGSGRDFTTVTNAMAKGAAGNTAALKKLFPQLDAGPDKVLTFAEAIDQLRGTYAGAAQAAAKNDLFGRLSAAWGQISEAVGTAALPSLEELSTWFSDPKHIEDVQTWISSIQDWATTVGEDLRGNLEDFITWLQSPDGQQALTQWGDLIRGIGDAAAWTSDNLGPLLAKLGQLKKLVDLLPSNLLLKYGPGAIAGNFDNGGTWNNPNGTPKRPTSGRTQFGGARTTQFTVNNYYPKAETSSQGTAAAQRAARAMGM